ncbi:DegT/DnrJ/EryC1/StrS family aminotransferase [Pelosinus propionicus]|uniref:dTDP-4-amino-4,6-dideoxygalactose transaminase n=1 Tax=Pelosinus propionicus DSM 13327 TaxID=1123291 RepID=A0A1I4HT23_9FIRM|nr:DegT/DnrJ/EryC1/StrS family aminotransferase [Pelosinus propionicus]SFL45339.1 dTDP-4-amino-4,6-dideoxygalactose transaminase [Pelosinus propionicus DSM 13327]
MTQHKAFEQPIYVTRPLLPNLSEIHVKLEEVWQSQWLTNIGKQHKQLEKRTTEVLKVPYLSLFNNGTIGLITACQSLRLQGEVITTPFTFAATPHVLMWNNIKPIFCDIDPITMNIDADKIESMITPQTTGILPVHVFGTPCDVEKIQEVADRYGLKIVYDAAHAFGVEINGVGIGNFGDISMMSFHATKLFHTVEGGALTYRDKHLKDRIDLLKNFGIKGQEEVVMPGINGKMNEIQAAIGLVVLNYIEEERRKRAILIDTYRRCLMDVEGISFLSDIAGVKSNSQYFVMRISEKIFGRSRNYVYDEFMKYNVFTRKYFYPLCSEYTCYRHLPSSSMVNLPVAHKVVQEVLSMPLYGELTVNEVEKICDILKSFQ